LAEERLKEAEQFNKIVVDAMRALEVDSSMPAANAKEGFEKAGR
jgi:hypothetical protein